MDNNLNDPKKRADKPADSTPLDAGPTHLPVPSPDAVPREVQVPTGNISSPEEKVRGVESTAEIPPGLVEGRKVGSGRFTLTRELGRGGMGVVWLARDERLKQDVALKLLPPEVAADEMALEDLRRETIKSQALVHTNIVSIRDLHEAPGEPPFILMEFVDGSNLRTLLGRQSQRCFEWKALRPLVGQLCDALEYAHSKKVVHRDLKPGNLMLDSDGRLKLADFGIAATISDSLSRVSKRGNDTSGTLIYMSPQQMDGSRPKVTDDIYSLGATLYELLTGNPPFYTGGQAAIIHQVHSVAPTPLSESLEDAGVKYKIPKHVEETVLACLAKERVDRPQTAAEVWTCLTNAAREAEQAVPKNAAPPPLPPPPVEPESRQPKNSTPPNAAGFKEAIRTPPQAKAPPAKPAKPAQPAQPAKRTSSSSTGNGIAIAGATVVIIIVVVGVCALAVWLGQNNRPSTPLSSNTATTSTPPADKIAAASDDADSSAMVKSGDRAFLGLDGRVDYPKALRMYKQAADKKFPKAYGRMAEICFSVPSLAGGKEDRLRWAKEGADLKDPEAMLNWGGVLEEGEAGEKSPDQANKLYAAAFPKIKQEAEEGDPFAQNVLGWFYDYGKGVAKNDSEALKWYRTAAEAGSASGKRNVGRMYLIGKGVTKDLAEAFKWDLKAADAGSAVAMRYVGNCYENGQGVARDYVEAVKWYRKSAEAGNDEGEVSLGVMFENGTGVTRDYAEALKWYRKAAETGNDYAQNNIGSLYQRGLGVDKDYSQALRWYHKAADGGNSDALDNIGLSYKNGWGVPQDYPEALKWFHNAADTGDANGNLYLGEMYENGWGVDKNYSESRILYRKAADAGNSLAENHLGVIYQNGVGVDKDPVEAVKWYRKASDAGEATAKSNLGVMYLRGEGVKEDDKEAFRLLRESAAAADSFGERNLAAMYENGWGTDANHELAIEWYRKSAAQGNVEAKAALKRLGQ